jgi:hypothetical protein
MLNAKPDRFHRFVDGLKSGVPQEKALEESFGEIAEFEASWRRHVLLSY